MVVVIKFKEGTEREIKNATGFNSTFGKGVAQITFSDSQGDQFEDFELKNIETITWHVDGSPNVTPAMTQAVSGESL
jgi:hypothetical protein